MFLKIMNHPTIIIKFGILHVNTYSVAVISLILLHTILNCSYIVLFVFHKNKLECRTMGEKTGNFETVTKNINIAIKKSYND